MVRQRSVSRSPDLPGDPGRTGDPGRRLPLWGLVAALLMLPLPTAASPIHAVAGRAGESRTGATSDTISPPLTLEAALARALDHSPRLRQWTAAREGAQAGAGWLGSPYLPTLSAAGSVTRARYPSTVTPIRQPGTFPPLAERISESSLTLGWTVFDFGQGRAAHAAARLLADGAAARERQARMEVLETVAGHFVHLATLEGVRTAQSARLEGMRASEAAVQALEEEGRVPAVDLLRVREGRMEAEEDLRATDDEVQRVLGSLGAELGLGRVGRDGVVDVRVSGVPGGTVSAVHERAGPAVEAAEARLEAARREASGARRGLLPEVQLLGQQRLRTAPDLPTDSDWMLGVQLRLPLFQGRALAGVQSREARVREREAELEWARSSLELAREDLALLEQGGRARLEVLDARIRHLEEARGIEEAAYREGRSTLSELLSTESRLSAARVEREGLVGTLVMGRIRSAALEGTLSVQGVRSLLGGEG